MKKDTNKRGGKVLVGMMIVLTVIIVVTTTIAFGLHSTTVRPHHEMFCGVAASIPEA